MDENKDATNKKEEKEVMPVWGQKLQEQLEKIANQLSNQSNTKPDVVEVPLPQAPKVETEVEMEVETETEVEVEKPKKKSLLDWLM